MMTCHCSGPSHWMARPFLLALERAMLTQRRVALADAALDFRQQFPLVAAGDFGRQDGDAVADADGTEARKLPPARPDLKPPSTATGRMAAFERTANAVNPGRNGAIAPSRVRVPSGKISTISPCFSRLSDSLIPASPTPSRSIGNAPTE